jgi:hypothetical protein
MHHQLVCQAVTIKKHFEITRPGHGVTSNQTIGKLPTLPPKQEKVNVAMT